MPAWSNTDAPNSKPKFSAERQTRELVQLTVANTAYSNLSLGGTNSSITFTYSDGFSLANNGSNLANIGVAAGQYVYASNVAGNGVAGFFSSNNTIASVTGNTITLTNPYFGNVTVGSIVEVDKAIVFNSNKTSEVNYNRDTVMVTPTRLANATFANGSQYTTSALANTGASSAHAGWVRVTTGTGGRAGRVQTEVLVALANSSASNTTSGNTSNSGTYYTGV
jgi:hypothetical protein